MKINFSAVKLRPKTTPIEKREIGDAAIRTRGTQNTYFSLSPNKGRSVLSNVTLWRYSISIFQKKFEFSQKWYSICLKESIFSNVIIFCRWNWIFTEWKSIWISIFTNYTLTFTEWNSTFRNRIQHSQNENIFLSL